MSIIKCKIPEQVHSVEDMTAVPERRPEVFDQLEQRAPKPSQTTKTKGNMVRREISEMGRSSYITDEKAPLVQTKHLHSDEDPVERETPSHRRSPCVSSAPT